MASPPSLICAGKNASCCLWLNVRLGQNTVIASYHLLLGPTVIAALIAKTGSRKTNVHLSCALGIRTMSPSRSASMIFAKRRSPMNPFSSSNRKDRLKLTKQRSRSIIPEVKRGHGSASCSFFRICRCRWRSKFRRLIH